MQRPDYDLFRLQDPRKVEVFNDALVKLNSHAQANNPVLNATNLNESWETFVQNVHTVATGQLSKRAIRNPRLDQLRKQRLADMRLFREPRLIDSWSRYNGLSDRRKRDPVIIQQQRELARRYRDNQRKEQRTAILDKLRKIEETSDYNARLNCMFRLIRFLKRSCPTLFPTISQQTLVRELAQLNHGPVPLIPEDFFPLPPPPSLDDIRAIMATQRNGKSPGTDFLFNEFLCIPEVESVLYHFISHAYLTNELPENWTETVMILLKKKTSPKVYDDMRPITLCSLPYKIYTRLLYNLLQPFMATIPEYQSGFLRNRSAEDSIFLINHVLTTNWNHGRPVFLLSIDLRRAFPSVNLHKIPALLQKLGAPAWLINRIISTCFVEKTGFSYNGQQTPKFSKTIGVKQGDPLSPYLFILILHYLLTEVQKELRQLSPPVDLYLGESEKPIQLPMLTAYADDINFLALSLKSLQRIYPVFVKWLSEFGLSINPSKCVLVLRSPDQLLHDSLGSTCQFGADTIPVRKQVTILGTRINSDMNRRNMIVERCNKALPVYYSLLRNLKDQRLPFPILVRLYRSILVPIMTFGLRPISFTKANQLLLMRREISMLRGFSKISFPPPKNESIYQVLRGRTINRFLSSGNLCYFGHALRSDPTSLIRKGLQYSLPGRRKVGRPCFSYNHVVKQAVAALLPFTTERELLTAFKSADTTKKICSLLYDTTHNELDPMPSSLTLEPTIINR